MSCIRCQGMMLEEPMIDMKAGYGEMWTRSWRCFNCGHRDDAVLQHHRQLRTNQVIVGAPGVPVQESISEELEMVPTPVELAA